MRFFSGFSLRDEAYLFEDILDPSIYSVAGFSYGAIKALEYVKTQLEKGNRVDRLQLLSPAFFQTKSAKFKRLQLLSYTKNQAAYLESFLTACFSPYPPQQLSYRATSKEQLQELLEYEWCLEDLLKLERAGVIVEVYLGSEDNIIDAPKAKEFF
jgi:hypothetical protein